MTRRERTEPVPKTKQFSQWQLDRFVNETIRDWAAWSRLSRVDWFPFETDFLPVQVLTDAPEILQ